LEIAKECNITFQKGDILFIRIGVTKEWDTVMTPAQKQAYADNPKPEHAGVEATIDVLRWLWNTGFAAIASDAISWEVSSSCPISRAEHQQGSAGPADLELQVYPPQNPDLFLHEYVIAGWGMPIGKWNGRVRSSLTRESIGLTRLAGELFDLEALAQTCAELQRWSFFVTSVPLNMPGGVSSPPNVMAIF